MWVKTAVSDRGGRNELGAERKKPREATLICRYPLSFSVQAEELTLGVI